MHHWTTQPSDQRDSKCKWSTMVRELHVTQTLSNHLYFSWKPRHPLLLKQWNFSTQDQGGVKPVACFRADRTASSIMVIFFFNLSWKMVLFTQTNKIKFALTLFMAFGNSLNIFWMIVIISRCTQYLKREVTNNWRSSETSSRHSCWKTSCRL